MAAQDYNTISQPALGVEANSLSLVVNKDQKKQQKELANLATVLKAVEAELASAKSGATHGSAKEDANVANPAAPAAPAHSAGASNNSLENALAKMAGALQLLQIEIAKYSDKKANSEHTISEAEKNIAVENLKKANHALKKLQHELDKQKTLGFWEKIGEAVAAVVLVVAAVALEQPELLIAAAIMIAGATGLLSKASNEISKLFEKMGVPNDIAKILGGIVLTLIVIAATFGAASVAGVGTGAAAVAEDAGEEGMEMTEIGADTTEDTTEETADSSSRLAKAGKLLKKLNFFRKFSGRTNLMIMAGTTSATQSKVISDIAGEIAYAIAKAEGKKDAKNIEKEVEMITEIIVAVMSLLVTAGSASALGEGANAAANAADDTTENTSTVSKVFSGFKEFGLSSKGQRLLLATNILSQLAVAGTGIGASVIGIERGELEIALTKYQADTVLNNIAIGMNNNEMQNSQKFIAQREKQIDTSKRSIEGVMKGEAALAQMLNTPMV